MAQLAAWGARRRDASVSPSHAAHPRPARFNVHIVFLVVAMHAVFAMASPYSSDPAFAEFTSMEVLDTDADVGEVVSGDVYSLLPPSDSDDSLLLVIVPIASGTAVRVSVVSPWVDPDEVGDDDVGVDFDEGVTRFTGQRVRWSGRYVAGPSTQEYETLSPVVSRHLPGTPLSRT